MPNLKQNGSYSYLKKGSLMAPIIDIKVIPRSGKQKFTTEQEIIKCHLKSQPEKGKANAELIKLISKRLKIPQNSITIISGGTSRKKRIKIDKNISLDELKDRLCQPTTGKE